MIKWFGYMFKTIYAAAFMCGFEENFTLNIWRVAQVQHIHKILLSQYQTI